MEVRDHVMCGDQKLDFGRISVVKNFISEEEEERIISAIDSLPWAESQSGRRKQVTRLYCVIKLSVMTTPTGLWTKSELQKTESKTREFHWTTVIQQVFG